MSRIKNSWSEMHLNLISILSILINIHILEKQRLDFVESFRLHLWNLVKKLWMNYGLSIDCLISWVLMRISVHLLSKPVHLINQILKSYRILITLFSLIVKVASLSLVWLIRVLLVIATFNTFIFKLFLKTMCFQMIMKLLFLIMSKTWLALWTFVLFRT